MDTQDERDRGGLEQEGGVVRRGGALIFYALASEPITTVAHVAAIAMGQAVWKVCVWTEPRKAKGE